MIKEEIKTNIEKALISLNIKSDNIIIQEPRNHKDVDYATNIALIISKDLNKNPMEIAENIATELKSNNNEIFDEIIIAKPGFINFKLSSNQYLKRISSIIEAGDKYGQSNSGKNKNS